MAGPMTIYLFVHEAILREVAHVEDIARELNRDDQAEIDALSERLAWFQKMVRRHEDSEEKVLFPALNERIRFVAETYKFDHDDFEVHVFEGIERALTGLARANGKYDRRENAGLLYRESVALHEHMRLHITKENELLIPKLEVEFDVPEQAEIAGAMAGVFDPQLMAETVNFTYGWHTADDREEMIRFLRGILPEEAFGGLTNHLKSNNADSWSEIERRIPDL